MFQRSFARGSQQFDVCNSFEGFDNLRNPCRPQAANVDGFVHKAVKDEPIPSLKTAMPAEMPPEAANSVHEGKIGEQFHFLDDGILVSLRESLQYQAH
jgi:hypothetical protein